MGKYLIGTIAIILVGCTIFYLDNYVLDTVHSRKNYARIIRALVQKSKDDPTNPEYPRAILSYTKSRNEFIATYATGSLDNLGDASNLILNEIADLMFDDRNIIKREAALSIKNLGNKSIPVLDKVAKRIESGNSHESTYYAIEILKDIGEPAIKYTPILKSKIGKISKKMDEALEDAIKHLTELKENQKIGTNSPQE